MPNNLTAISLKDQARSVLVNLTSSQEHDHAILVNSLKGKFEPSNQNYVHRTQLRERRDRVRETLSEIGQSKMKLNNIPTST